MSEEELDSSQAVIVSFNLPSDISDREILKHVYAIEDRLDEALEKTGIGDCDGHEFSDGWGIIYIYGSDADKLFEVARPILADAPFKPMDIILRYGIANDKDAKEAKRRIN
jgi:hypothetical protein